GGHPPPLACTPPSGEKASADTLPRCSSAATSCAAATLHSRTVWSQLAEARVLPSGEKARAVTRSRWLINPPFSRPPGTSHSRMRRSRVPTASVWPSAVKAPHRTAGPACSPSVVGDQQRTVRGERQARRVRTLLAAFVQPDRGGAR